MTLTRDLETGRYHYQTAPCAPTTGEALRLRHMIEMIRVHPGSDLTNAWELVKLHGGTKPNGLLYSQAQLEANATRELTSIAARLEWANLAKEMG